MFLEILKKKKKGEGRDGGEEGENTLHRSGTCLPDSDCSSVGRKHPFSEALKKDDR